MNTISLRTFNPGSAGASISIPRDSMSWISAARGFTSQNLQDSRCKSRRSSGRAVEHGGVTGLADVEHGDVVLPHGLRQRGGKARARPLALDRQQEDLAARHLC